MIKNMKLKRMVSCFLAAVIGASMLSGCGEKQKENADGTVTLKWMAAGQGMQQDSQKVWDKFNEKLKEYLPGVQVQFDPITFTDFAEKWQLSCAAGEEADIVWTGYAFSIPDQVNKGAYMELDDLLNEDAPELKAEIPDWAWKLGSYKGKVYVVPIMQQYAAKSALMAPKALTDKYMNKEKVVEANKTGLGTTQEGFDSIAEYLEVLKKDGKIGKGIYPSNIAACRHSTTDGAFWDSPVANVFVKKNEDGSFSVYNDCDMPGVKLTYKNMADWYTKGYIMSDILTVKDINSYVGKEDGIVLSTTQVLKGEQERKSKQYGIDIDLIETGNSNYKLLAGACKTGLAIPRTSKHPKEAMQLLQLLNTEKGKELYNMLVYGLEGEHYEKVGENRIKTFDYSGSSPKSTSKYGVDKWCVGNTYYAYETTDVPEGWNTYIKEVNEEAAGNVSPLMGFSFDITPVKVELAQIQAIKDQYETVLINGAKGADWEAYFNEYVEKLNTAGQDKLKKEVEKQLNEWTGETK